MLALNNNQRSSPIPKSSSSKSNLNSNQKNKMQKSESATLMISKALLMLNGKLFTKNFKKYMMLEPILFSVNYPSEI